MTPEERELLTRSIHLSEENNKILRGIRRRGRISTFIRVIYWIIIIISVTGAYYVIKPYIQPVVDGYNNIKKTVDTVQNTTTKLPTLPSWLGGK